LTARFSAGPWQLAENMLRLASGNVRFLEFSVGTTETDQTVKIEQLIDQFANDSKLFPSQFLPRPELPRLVFQPIVI
jgi:hypothetical protein